LEHIDKISLSKLNQAIYIFSRLKSEVGVVAYPAVLFLLIITAVLYYPVKQGRPIAH